MKNPFSLSFLFSNKEEESEVYYPVCPKCISPQLRILKEFTSGWLTRPKYVCTNCNYTGHIILEIDIKMLDKYTPDEIRQMYYEELINDQPEQTIEAD